MLKMNFKKLNENAVTPTYGTEFSAGADLYACEGGEVTIEPGESKLIHTGLSLEIPVGYAGLIYARSGIATKRGLAPANKVGVIDSDYRGEIMVCLFNHSNTAQTISDKERIAQLVITPFLQVEYCDDDAGRNVAGGHMDTGQQILFRHGDQPPKKHG